LHCKPLENTKKLKILGFKFSVDAEMPKNCHKSKNNHKRRNTIPSIPPIWPFRQFGHSVNSAIPSIPPFRQFRHSVNSAIP
jgi:hypothetical protein